MANKWKFSNKRERIEVPQEGLAVCRCSGKCAKGFADCNRCNKSLVSKDTRSRNEFYLLSRSRMDSVNGDNTVLTSCDECFGICKASARNLANV